MSFASLRKSPRVPPWSPHLQKMISACYLSEGIVPSEFSNLSSNSCGVTFVTRLPLTHLHKSLSVIYLTRVTKADWKAFIPSGPFLTVLIFPLVSNPTCTAPKIPGSVQDLLPGSSHGFLCRPFPSLCIRNVHGLEFSFFSFDLWTGSGQKARIYPTGQMIPAKNSNDLVQKDCLECFPE